MYTRRAFLKTTTIGCAAGGVLGWRTLLRAADPKPLIVREAKVIRVRDRQKGGPSDSYLEITSESGLNGYAGPLLKEQVAAIPANLNELLAGRDAADPEQLNFGTLWAACHPGKTLESYVDGKDPLTGAPVWGTKRTSRQTETGWVITALSAIDLALWDLRGKAAVQPVWRLLGGQRQRLNAYASMLGYSVQPAEARKAARTMFDRGFHRQKWFFMNGPADGAAGLKQNIELAHAVREELGPKAILMFDGIQYVWKSVDVDYAIALAKGILTCQPHLAGGAVASRRPGGLHATEGRDGDHAGRGRALVHTLERQAVSGSWDRQLRAVGPGVVRRDQRMAEDLRTGQEVSWRAGRSARPPCPGGFGLRGIAKRDALPDVGVPDPIAGRVPALPDPPLGGRSGNLRDAGRARPGPFPGRAQDGKGVTDGSPSTRLPLMVAVSSSLTPPIRSNSQGDKFTMVSMPSTGLSFV